MLSETLKSREALKLSFNRSISEPGSRHTTTGVLTMPPLVSPPSLAPNIHPPIKRCKMEQRVKPVCLLASNGAESSSMGDSQPSAVKSPHHHHNNQQQNEFLTPPGTVSLPTSPCSDSSTIQRSLVIKQATTITSDGLAKYLHKLQPTSATGSGGVVSPPTAVVGPSPAASLPIGGGVVGTKHGRNLLLLDCRPFIAYNVCHIRGAINVNCCDRFNRKRLQQGKASLADLATTKEGKELLKKRNWKEVVVYDDSSEDLASLPSSHTLFLVISSLVEDLRQPLMLVGGLRCFQATQSSLCEDHLMRPGLPPPLGFPGFPAPPSPSDMSPTKDIENHPPSQVTNFLLLGNMKDAGDTEVLRRLGVDHVLNVTTTPPCYTPSTDIVYKQLHAADNGYQNLRQYFDEAFEFIDLARRRGGAVMIHCQAGVSRSPTIAVAYLIKHFPMSMVEAYRFVKSRRSIISPNLNFMGQLLEFEQGLAREKEEKKAAWGGSGSGMDSPSIVANSPNNHILHMNNNNNINNHHSSSSSIICPVSGLVESSPSTLATTSTTFSSSSSSSTSPASPLLLLDNHSNSSSCSSGSSSSRSSTSSLSSSCGVSSSKSSWSDGSTDSLTVGSSVSRLIRPQDLTTSGCNV